MIEHNLQSLVTAQGTINKTILELKIFATSNPDYIVKTDYGDKKISDLLIEYAISRCEEYEDWSKVERYLNIDGYSLIREKKEGLFKPKFIVTGYTASLPSFAQIAQSASELEELLSKNNFITTMRHLESARKNIVQEQWEAANSQCRTFLESLTDEIANKLYPDEAATRKSGLAKRQLLADKGFLSREKHEFGDGNGQTFLPGLVKLLHTDGSHPGVSTHEDAIFRLQLVVVTASLFLKRLELQKGK
ncbi:hypothetical protein [Neomegalonema perideroedes]|uniref:hypothetical protein n=1 Tax=Neomegalonema perideroedes TaxID=217219 RepID=UPI0012FD27CB|nr:hypothetical protein [Neomegalonema perideroedes]